MAAYIPRMVMGSIDHQLKSCPLIKIASQNQNFGAESGDDTAHHRLQPILADQFLRPMFYLEERTVVGMMIGPMKFLRGSSMLLGTFFLTTRQRRTHQHRFKCQPLEMKYNSHFPARSVCCSAYSFRKDRSDGRTSRGCASFVTYELCSTRYWSEGGWENVVQSYLARDRIRACKLNDVHYCRIVDLGAGNEREVAEEFQTRQGCLHVCFWHWDWGKEEGKEYKSK